MIVIKLAAIAVFVTIIVHVRNACIKDVRQ